MYRVVSNIFTLSLKILFNYFVFSDKPPSTKLTKRNAVGIGIIFFIVSFFPSSPAWLTFIKIILSNDVETNPGDITNGFFTFCNWNLNSLAKDDFHRIRLIEAHNSLFNYDIISLCETSLNDSITLPDVMLEDYSFISCNNPLNVKHGGVGLFYKNTLPVKQRLDLSFDETIVLELMFGRKKIFFTVLYRSPAYNVGSIQFDNFLGNFKNLYENIKNENPYSMFFYRQFQWPFTNLVEQGRYKCGRRGNRILNVLSRPYAIDQ